MANKAPFRLLRSTKSDPPKPLTAEQQKRVDANWDRIIRGEPPAGGWKRRR
jgi:hypothetical protein